MNNFIILIPTFNDWRSLNKLLLEVDKNILGFKGNFKVLIINDASTTEPKFNLKNIKRLRNIRILTLKKNLGSQKSICLGLKYLKKKKTKAIIVIMDSDGEDDPKQVKKLINLAEKNPKSVISANRLKRRENIFFKFLYKLHLFITFLFTGKYIDFGNYCSFSSLNLKRLLSNANLWLACSAGVIKNCDSIKPHYANRKKRYFDLSKTKLSFLFIHSLNIISVFKSDVQRNSLIFCSILLLIFLSVKMSIIIIAIIIVIIFNIVIHYRGNKIDDFNNCLNLIKHIRKY